MKRGVAGLKIAIGQKVRKDSVGLIPIEGRDVASRCDAENEKDADEDRESAGDVRKGDCAIK